MGLGQGERVRASGRTALLAVCVATLVGCSDDRDRIDAEFGGATWESEHYRYRYRQDDPMACEGVLDSLESYGGLVADLLGVTDGERTKSSYYKYPTQEAFDAAEVCRSTASACTDTSSIYAAVPLAGHELVHNVMAKRTGTDVSLLLAEGLANALTCDPHSAADLAGWDFRAFKRRPDEHDVARAGRLVLGLLRRISPVELLAVIDATRADDSAERVRQLLLERHGVDLDDVLREIEADGTSACVPIYSCSGEPLPVGKSKLVHDCRGPSPATLPREHAALSVRVTEARVRFMPCDWSAPSSPLAGLWPYWPFSLYYWLQPPSTPHALWLDRAESYTEPLETNIDLAPLSGVFTQACHLDQAHPLTYSAQVAIVLDGRAEVAHFPLAFSEPAQLGLVWQMSTDPDLYRVPTRPVSVSYCRSCVGGLADQCTELHDLQVERRWIEVAEAGVVVVRTSAPLPRAAVLELSLRKQGQ